jgi:hypothetical protein
VTNGDVISEMQVTFSCDVVFDPVDKLVLKEDCGLDI